MQHTHGHRGETCDPGRAAASERLLRVRGPARNVAC
jgi:hypothetical protein